MEQLLQFFIFLPLAGFIISFFFANKQEKIISAVSYLSVGLFLIGIVLFTVYWIFQGAPILNQKHYVFYKEDKIEIFLDFYFDKITAVYAILGALITFLVVVFSKYYLHRDAGFKRFFNTLLLFFFGYNIAVFAGNFETLFVGWEFLGITSFLLIAFYRDRYLPVKNAMKTISLYRFGDICLILSLWTSHHIWHENITFEQLENAQLVLDHIAENYNSVLFLLSMVVVAATIKSAQFPFSSWLPRAMEGPTTSSAVFYGALSVHLGVFLLLRTHNYWESIFAIKILIIAIGVCTVLAATLIARVQSTVKTQIAYSSVAQIGLMFVEVALGWHILALVHLTGNALLRSYQLLVSPSVLGYMIHDQFFNYTPKQYLIKNSFTSKLRNTIYLLSLKEWNLDQYLKTIFWNPLKYAGKKLDFLSNILGLFVLSAIYIIGLFFLIFDNHIPKAIDEFIHILFAIIGLVLILMAFSERKSAIKAWLMIIISQFYVVLSIALVNDEYEYNEILLYVCGLITAAIIGTIILIRVKKAKNQLELNDFYGHIYEFPIAGFWFLISCLAFVCLPFTPSFIGIDLMFSHIDHDEYLLVGITSISFLVLELAVLRIYSRVFLGPSKLNNHPIAFRSS